MNFPWTPENIERCHRLFIEEGRSASETASLLGSRCTRNGVVGKAYRMGWKKRQGDGLKETDLSVELLADLPSFQAPVTIKLLTDWYGAKPSRVAAAVGILFRSGHLKIGMAA